MITTAFLNLIYFFVLGITGVLGSFGEVSTNNSLTESILVANSYFSALALLLPLTTIFAIIIFDLVFENTNFLYKLIRWGYRKVPGIN